MYCLVITTCSKDDEARIKEALLKEGLAACISSFDVSSSYIWKERIEEAKERMLFIKTKKEKWEKVKQRIKQLHSYELPEIICIDFDGSMDYLRWIDSVVK
jgi:periplasmic divalent cation tolerance protein